YCIAPTQVSRPANAAIKKNANRRRRLATKPIWTAPGIYRRRHATPGAYGGFITEGDGSGRLGRLIVKPLPPWLRGPAHTDPPMASTSSLHRDRPMPEPETSMPAGT